MHEPHEDGYYTYADYRKWDNSCVLYWELIDGRPYLSDLSGENEKSALAKLLNIVKNQLSGTGVRAFSDFEMRLDWNKSDDTVVRPDIFVVGDPSVIIEETLMGVPELIIEVFASCTTSYDLVTKFRKYRKSDVQELWLVNPSFLTQTVQVFTLADGAYIADNYGPADKITSGILPELTIDLKDIFETEETQEGEIS